MKLNIQVGPAVAIRVGLALLLLAAVAEAKTAVLWLEGRTEPLRGELVSETPGQITIRIAGIETSIERSRIRRVEYELSVAEQYEQRRAALDEDDHRERYELARWLYRKGEDQTDKLARKELRALVKAAPDMQQAQLLLELVEQRIKERAEAEAERDRPDDQGGPQGGGEGQAGDGEVDGGEPATPKYLTEKQRNLIKVMEINLDADPRVVVPRDIAEKFYEAYRDEPVMQEYEGRSGRNRFLRMSGEEMLGVMFRARAREFYDEVIVRTEPEPLREFKLTWSRGLVAGYCGECHGLDDADPAPGLALYTRGANRDEVAYTNFLILNRGNVGGQAMLDRSQPARSLLVQYALPREDADQPHPEVEGMRPFLRGKNDRRHEQLLDWINALWGQQQVRYPIEFEMPGRPAANDGGDDDAAGDAGQDEAGNGGEDGDG